MPASESVSSAWLSSPPTRCLVGVPSLSRRIERVGLVVVVLALGEASREGRDGAYSSPAVVALPSSASSPIANVSSSPEGAAETRDEGASLGFRAGNA